MIDDSLHLPAWVLQDLYRRGLPSWGGSVVTTHRRQRAVPRWCPCSAPVWTGLCDRHDVTLDPTPTTPDGELYAILTNRRTYEIDLHHLEIIRRHPAHILNATADNVRVYIDHNCSGPAAIVNDKWAPAEKEETDVIPF